METGIATASIRRPPLMEAVIFPASVNQIGKTKKRKSPMSKPIGPGSGPPLWEQALPNAASPPWLDPGRHDPFHSSRVSIRHHRDLIRPLHDWKCCHRHRIHRRRGGGGAPDPPSARRREPDPLPVRRTGTDPQSVKWRRPDPPPMRRRRPNLPLAPVKARMQVPLDLGPDVPSMARGGEDTMGVEGGEGRSTRECERMGHLVEGERAEER